MKALQVVRNGKPTEALEIVDVDLPPPNPGEVHIRVEAASLNFNDIDRCYGRLTSIPLEPPFTLGMDCCGEVIAAGEGAGLWKGKRVVAITQRALGGIAEVAVAGKDSIFMIPDGLSAVEAAAFIIPFHTMHLALIRRAQLRDNDTVVITAGASALGLAGIQIAKAYGATVIAVVGSDTKINTCEQAGADHVINYNKVDFADVVLKETDEQGASVICDLVGGDDVAGKAWRCVAAEGRYVQIGFADDEGNGMTPRALRPLNAANFSVIGVMLAWGTPPIKELRRFGFSMFPREVADETHNDLCSLIRCGKIRPNIGRMLDVSDVGKILEEHENRLTTGKSVVTGFNWNG